MIKGFSLDIYNLCISFAWETNPKEIDALLNQCNSTDECREVVKEFFESANGGALTVNTDAMNILSVFKDEPNNAIVAHEIYHIACRVMQPRGIVDEEAWAYLIGYLTEMFYDLYLDKVETEEVIPK